MIKLAWDPGGVLGVSLFSSWSSLVFRRCHPTILPLRANQAWKHAGPDLASSRLTGERCSRAYRRSCCGGWLLSVPTACCAQQEEGGPAATRTARRASPWTLPRGANRRCVQEVRRVGEAIQYVVLLEYAVMQRPLSWSFAGRSDAGPLNHHRLGRALLPDPWLKMDCAQQPQGGRRAAREARVQLCGPTAVRHV